MATKPLKVLFADDDDAFRFVMHSVLKDAGFDATAVESGEKAIEAIKAHAFDVIVLDYKMGEVSGLNVLQWIHEQKITTPVIMVTAAGTETVAVEAMKLGAYDYVRKEHIEIDHFELTINAVYERYLFRKEREEREVDERRREKNLAALEMHHNTAEAFTEFLTNSLTVFSMRMDEFSRDMLPLIKEENKEFFTSSFKGLRQDLSVLSSALESVVNLTNIVTSNATTLMSKTTAQEEVQSHSSEVNATKVEQKQTHN
jgi:DNA-binding response OmpR family regulator